MVLHAVLVAVILAGAREFPVLPGAQPVFIVPLPEGGERAMELPAYREPAAGFRLPLPGLPVDRRARPGEAVRLRELSDAARRIFLPRIWASDRSCNCAGSSCGGAETGITGTGGAAIVT